MSTNAKDLQSGEATRVPALHADGGKLAGTSPPWMRRGTSSRSTRARPSRTARSPGNTTAPTGTYNAATGRYSLTWTSQIVGGPFDKFTGLWHLEGTFVPAGAGRTATTARSSTAGTTPTAGVAGGGSATTVAPANGSAAAPDAASPSATVDQGQASGWPATWPSRSTTARSRRPPGWSCSSPWRDRRCGGPPRPPPRAAWPPRRERDPVTTTTSPTPTATTDKPGWRLFSFPDPVNGIWRDWSPRASS